MKKIENKYLVASLYGIATLVVSAVLVHFILSGFFSKLFTILGPVFVGFAIAYLINPIVVFLEKKVFRFKSDKKIVIRLRRFLSILLAYVFTLVLLSAVFAILIPQLFSSFEEFGNNLSRYQEALEKWGVSLLDKESRFYPVFEELLNFVDSLIDMAISYVSNLVPKVLVWAKDISTFLVKFFVNMLVSLFVSIYMISRKEALIAQIKKPISALFSKKWVARADDFAKMLDHSVGGFIRGKIIDSVIIGVLCYVVMLILRFDYPLLISFIVGITNVIPFFGPFIGAIPSAFILLMVNPKEVIPFIIVILLIQQLDGNVIGPKILGDTMGLSSFWVLVSIVVMSGLFGFVGMIIGVPIFSVFYTIVERLVDKRLAEKSLPTDPDAYYGAFPSADNHHSDTEEQ